MMNVYEMLNAYNFNKRRIAVLEYNIACLESDYAYEESAELDDLAGVKSPGFTDEPKASGYNADKIPDAVAQIIDGGEGARRAEIRGKIEVCEREKACLLMQVQLCDKLLETMNDVERFVIFEKVCNGRVWSDTVARFQKKFGYYASKDTLRRTKKSVMTNLQRICDGSAT